MGYSASYSPAGGRLAEASVLFTPRRPSTAKRAVVYFHGAGGNATQCLDGASYKSWSRMAGMAAQAGLVVLSADWGGAQTWGNDTFLTAAETAWTWLKASGLCATDKLIVTGASMGYLSASRFAA